jgi:hypothetical protein
MKYNFIEKAKEVHGKTYSYANTVYTNKRTKVTITCKTHGDSYKVLNIIYKGQAVKNVIYLK